MNFIQNDYVQTDLGQGAFAKLFKLVHKNDPQTVFALKVAHATKQELETRAYEEIENEVKILTFVTLFFIKIILITNFFTCIAPLFIDR